MEDGTRFAQLWANKTKGNTYALKNARSNYIFINRTMDEIERAYDLFLSIRGMEDKERAKKRQRTDR